MIDTACNIIKDFGFGQGEEIFKAVSKVNNGKEYCQSRELKGLA